MDIRERLFRDPNTRVLLEDLTDDTLAKIRELYDAQGLACDRDFLKNPSSRVVRRDLEERGRMQLRVTRVGEGKAHFELMRAANSQEYVHFTVGLRGSAHMAEPDYLIKLNAFYKSMYDHFVDN